MRRCSQVLLAGTLLSALAWGQEVSVYSTTMAQYWKQEVPGFTKNTFAPLTEFLGVDATKLGLEGLSMHLDGWAMRDLADASFRPEHKSAGYLSTGYLQYRFAQANAEIKAGRFLITPGMTVEQVDGISARTDLRWGLSVSAFGGRPVLFRTAQASAQSDYDYQHDFIFGTRLASRLGWIGEAGLSYLQDGTTQAQDLTVPSSVDYTRRQVGLDFKLVPWTRVDLSGRSFFNVAARPTLAPGSGSPSRAAEHDYTLTIKAAPSLSVSGNYTERNFQAYFAGSNLPSLFNPVERDAHRSLEGRITWMPEAFFQMSADCRQTHRDTYGDATRYGLQARVGFDAARIKAGIGCHFVDADPAKVPDAPAFTYTLSHQEMRAWIMHESGILSASFDGVYRAFDHANGPDLKGRSSLYLLVASLGVQAGQALKCSADVSYGSDALFENELRGLVRVEYRFGMADKGGR